MSRWKTWAWMAVIFISGVAVGSGGTVVMVKQHFRAFMDRPPREMREDLFDKIAARLDLTPDQVTRVRPIMEKGFEDADRIWNSTRPKLEAAMNRTRDELAPILTPAQMETFNQGLEHFRRAKHPPPPPPPPFD